jgi:hypothetical protein
MQYAKRFGTSTQVVPSSHADAAPLQSSKQRGVDAPSFGSDGAQTSPSPQ